MSEPSPPSSPPPGWYPDPDPATSSGYRWWDGGTWTDATADGDALKAGSVPVPALTALPDSEPLLGPIGPWVAESFRLTISRFGHVLPVILFFVLLVSIPTSFGVWYALRDTVITFDPVSASPEISYGGSRPWLIAVIALFPIATILSFFAKGAAIRQAWTTNECNPEPWSDSVMDLVRNRRLIPIMAGRTLLYWGLNALFFVAVALSPVFILAFPILVGVLVIIWVRLSFIGTVAVLGDETDKPYATSWRLSGVTQLPLTGRLLLLAFVSLNMILAAGVLGAPFTALVGPSDAPVQTSAETLRFNDLLGPNPAVLAIGSLFNAFGLGINYVLSAVGTTLLYLKLGGAVPGRAGDEADPTPPSV